MGINTNELTLEQIRVLRGKSQEQMADILGVHVQTYRKIEKNPEEATIAQAKIISQELDWEYNAIFFGQ
jgi:DNA-binding XRE family transcriptional regulator